MTLTFDLWTPTNYTLVPFPKYYHWSKSEVPRCYGSKVRVDRTKVGRNKNKEKFCLSRDAGYHCPESQFKIDREDLEQLNQSRKEEYYPLGIENEFCGSTIRKQQIKEFNKGKYNSGFALVYIMKTEKTGLYIISKEIQNDLTMKSVT